MNAVATTQPKPQIMAGGQIAALVPQSLDEAFRLATAIAASGLAPTGVEKPEQVLVAIMAGAELGFAPFQAMQSFAVINGKPNIWGDALPALLWSRGFKIKEWFDNDDEPTKAFCRITRPDGEEIERTFSVADAKRAGLAGKAGPWQQYQKRMLQMRARAFTARDGAADVLRGMQVAEEVQDYGHARDVTPRAAPNLAARLSAPTDGPREGFTSVHAAPADDDTIPNFDTDSPPEPVSEEPAADVSDLSSAAGDVFPGDLPPAGDGGAAGPAEAHAYEETGSAAATDVAAWADALIGDLPFLKAEQIDHLEQDRKELAKFAVLKTMDIAKARELEKAIVDAKAAFK